MLPKHRASAAAFALCKMLAMTSTKPWQALAFMAPGKPEEEDPSSGNYSACSDSSYCMIYG